MPAEPHPSANAAAGVSYATVSDAAAFAELRPRWDGLVRAMPRPSPFMLHAWLSQWWQHHGSDARLAVQVAYRGDRLTGALPLVVRSRRGVRVAEFIGGGDSALADILLAEGESEEVGGALAQRSAKSGQDLADLFGLAASSRLARALPPSQLRLVERVEAPVLDLASGWEAVYRDKTTSKKRNLHKRRRRQLEELGHLEVELARTVDDLVPALEEAFRLHALRWLGRPDGSGFITDAGKAFHRAAIRELATLGVPRILTLKLGGKAIAFHYYFAFCDRMFVHRLAFDPEYARFSPGLVSTLFALEAAAEEGLKRVEYLGGAERYKVELADRLEPLHQGLGLVGSPLGRAILEARLASIRLRKRLKRSDTLRSFYFDGLAPARRVLARLRSGAQPAD